MIVSINLDTTEGISAYDRDILLALAGQSQAQLNDEDDAYRRGMQAARDAQRTDAEEIHEEAQDNDGLTERDIPAEDQDTDEPPIAEQVDDDLPRHPDGRIVGRPSEGKKRRTKAQIEEDEAWEADRGFVGGVVPGADPGPPSDADFGVTEQATEQATEAPAPQPAQPEAGPADESSVSAEDAPPQQEPSFFNW